MYRQPKMQVHGMNFVTSRSRAIDSIHLHSVHHTLTTINDLFLYTETRGLEFETFGNRLATVICLPTLQNFHLGMQIRTSLLTRQFAVRIFHPNYRGKFMLLCNDL